MKKQTDPGVQTHLIRSAFYVLLLLTVCVIPFALAQRNSPKQNVAKLGNALPDTIIVVTNTNDSGPGSLRAASPLGATPTPTPTCTPSQFHVLIVYSDTLPPIQLQSQVLAQPGVTTVDLFDGASDTPTLGQLQQYQIVVPLSNIGAPPGFLDATALGNNLADYVDGGGVVVQYGFTFYGPSQPHGVNGRWVAGNYNPYDYSTNFLDTGFILGTFDAGHPLMAGVTTLNSGFADNVTLAAGAAEVAQTNVGTSLVAFRLVSGGHTTVGVTAYVGATTAQSGDWGKVIANAGRWLISGPCPSPTPTSTVSPTATPSPTPTRRVTPRPRPTPHLRPTPPQ